MGHYHKRPQYKSTFSSKVISRAAQLSNRFSYRFKIYITKSLSPMFKWTCKTTDVKAALLQSHAIDREIYLEPPPEFNSSGKLWKLNQAVYGLTDAARQWFDSVKDAFLSLKCSQSKYEPALFFRYDSNKLQGMTVIHVDDFIHASTEAFKKQVLNNLQKVFEIGKTAEISFKYIGLNI